MKWTKGQTYTSTIIVVGKARLSTRVTLTILVNLCAGTKDQTEDRLLLMESLESNTGDLCVASLLCDCFTVFCVDCQQLKVQATQNKPGGSERDNNRRYTFIVYSRYNHSCIACHILITQPKVATPKKKKKKTASEFQIRVIGSPAPATCKLLYFSACKYNMYNVAYLTHF